MIKDFYSKARSAFIGSSQGIKDIIVSMMPQIISFFTGFLSSVLIAHGLGPDGMGLYALILTIPNALINLSDLGIGQTAIRYASRAEAYGDREAFAGILRWAFRLRIIIITVISIAAIAFIPILTNYIWHRPDINGLIIFSLLISFFNVLAVVPTIYFQARQKFMVNSLVRIGQLLLSFSGIVLLAFLKAWRVDYLVSITVFTAFVSSTAFIVMVPKNNLWNRDEAISLLKKGFQGLWAPPKYDSLESKVDNTSVGKFAIYMMIASIVVAITLQLDVWMMGAFLDNSDIGIYSAAQKFTLPLVVFLNGLSTALWPRVSGAITKERILGLLKKLVIFSIPIFVLAFLYSMTIPLLVPFFFGSRFSSGIQVGQLLCLRYSVSLLFIPISIIGYALGMAKQYWVINILQLLVVLFVNFLLLPRIGVKGAAIALICNEMVAGIFVSILILRKIRELRWVQ